MYKLHDIIKDIQHHEKDLGETFSAEVKDLYSALTSTPNVYDFSYVVSCLMLAELIACPKSDTELGVQANSLWKFTFSSLRVLKKQLPTKATERLERMIKDSAAQVKLEYN